MKGVVNAHEAGNERFLRQRSFSGYFFLEHGGEPKSIAICHSLGLNYVSCSPYRVPVARLAAAQAKLAAE